ncbi:response regulator transcription factor [Pontiellaceae bacterium B12219]|nr:response regulator transcription factor [Pontiellaceae bacterium B12219]
MLVEDSPEFREVMAFGLSDEPDMEIVDQFNTADAALRSLENAPQSTMPDLILLDLNLPGISGLEAVPRFKTCAPKTEIIILTESEREADVLSAISSGAVGYLLKESSLANITEGIRTVMDGGASLDPVMARYLLNNQSRYSLQKEGTTQLSVREAQILNLLAEGKLQKQIADELSISPKTVGFHIGHIYEKLEVQNAPAAIHKAHYLGIFRK